MQHNDCANDRLEAKKARKSHKEMFHTLFGIRYVPEFFATALVCLSVIFALFIPYAGLFPTTKSEGMTNYHRWLYDPFVIVSSIIGVPLYILLSVRKNNAILRQKWKAYIDAQADYKFYRYQKAQLQGKKPLLHGAVSEAVFLLLFISLFILMYSVMTPSEPRRRGDFWIQTWWPINAAIIGVLYYSQFWLYVRVFAIKEIELHYRVLLRRRHRKLQDK